MTPHSLNPEEKKKFSTKRSKGITDGLERFHLQISEKATETPRYRLSYCSFPTGRAYLNNAKAAHAYLEMIDYSTQIGLTLLASLSHTGVTDQWWTATELVFGIRRTVGVHPDLLSS